MLCPKCGGATRVVETRTPRRRCECRTCGTRFSTVEVLVGDDKDHRALIASLAIRLRVMKPALVDLLEDLEKLP